MTTDTRKTAEISLDFPFTFDAQEVAKLTMRRPKVRDSLVASEANVSEPRQILRLYAGLCDCPAEWLEELDEVDFKKVEEQYRAFTGRQAENTPAKN